MQREPASRTEPRQAGSATGGEPGDRTHYNGVPVLAGEAAAVRAGSSESVVHCSRRLGANRGESITMHAESRKAGRALKRSDGAAR